MLPKKNRLKKGFRGVLRYGKRAKSTHFIIMYKTHQDQYPRFGILITKKIGGAVLRNKIKRQIKQVIRMHLLDKELHTDFVIIPSRYIENWKDVSFEMIEKDLLQTLATI